MVVSTGWINMFKTLKWLYDLGRMHERRRIELAIKNYRSQSIICSDAMTMRKEDFDKQEELNRAVENEIRRLMYPTHTEYIEKTILDD